MRSRFQRSLGVRVLAAVALLATALAARAEGPVTPPAPAVAAPAPQRSILGRTDVPGGNQEVVYVLVEVPAHVAVARHTHPGAVFGYLLEGDYTMLIDGQPPRALRPGEWLQVPSGVPHAERAGARAARLLAVFTVEKGKPLTAPAP
ncbi:MAG: cupin domain-containing protein [Gammaproteobacteria bacterium]|nr:cupin domain-containing protein [Gammaproteobacteria bacterium]